MKITGDYTEIKSLIRKEKTGLRKKLSREDVRALSEKICARILASREYEDAEYLLVYSAVNNEVELSGVVAKAKADGKSVAYPICTDVGRMEAWLPEDDSAFVKGRFGISEPDINRSKPLRPERIDLVLCPLAAFDERCARLGMGGGYYDRYLPECKNAVIAAVAYEMQKTQAIPCESTDVRMDIIFTEGGTYRRQ